MSDAVETVGDMLPFNPLGAALVGAGLLWMFTGAKASEAALGALRSATDSLPDRRAMLRTPDVRAAVDTTRETMGRMFSAQPLLLAAGGLLVGAAIAASLPKTQVEAQALGDAADELKRRAGDFVAQAAGQAKDTAQEAGAAMQDRAREAGREAGLI